MAGKNSKRVVKIKEVVIKHPKLFVADSFQGGAAKFSAHLMIDKADADLVGRIKVAMAEAMEEQWPKAAPKLTGYKNPFRDGDEVSWGGYAGHFFLSASNYRAPKVFDIDGSDLTVNDDFNTPGDKPQGGDIVNAHIVITCYDNQFGKQVIANLSGIQFVRVGDRYIDPNDEDMFSETIVAGAARAPKPAASNTANVFARNGNDMFAETTVPRQPKPVDRGANSLHPEDGDDIFDN